MKQPKKLTYAQKKALSRLGLNPDNYRFCSESDSVFVLWDIRGNKKTEIRKDKIS